VLYVEVTTVDIMVGRDPKYGRKTVFRGVKVCSNKDLARTAEGFITVYLQLDTSALEEKKIISVAHVCRIKLPATA
jgi:hypothetical protein